jgi:virginiamycin A acetyltransferase
MKKYFKRLVYGVFIILALPLWLLFVIQSLALGRNRSFYDCSQFLSLIPGTLGDYFRFAFYKLTLPHLGENTCICFGATLANPDICIGRGVYIGPYCNLGLCTIEDDVLFGTDVHVISGFAQHGYADLNVPIRDQENRLLNVRIGADTWIGNKTVVGNHVGVKCIIGAASLVNREIPPYSIAVGNPAKVIRDRREQKNI